MSLSNFHRLRLFYFRYWQHLQPSHHKYLQPSQPKYLQASSATTNTSNTATPCNPTTSDTSIPCNPPSSNTDTPPQPLPLGKKLKNTEHGQTALELRDIEEVLLRLGISYH